MLKRFFISMLGTMAGLWVALFLLFFAGMLALGIAIGKGSGDSMVKVEKHSALYFDLSGEVAERVQPADFMQLLQQAENNTPTLEDMLLALKTAADDDKIEGLYLNCSGAAMGMAAREELLEAIYAFQESGKWVYAYSDNYGEGDYMIATTADCVALNPVGSIDIHGLGGMSPFFKGLLDKVGIKMQIIKVGTYKSAVEPFILTSMSEPAKEQMQQYLDSIWSYMSATMADNRGLSVDSIRAMASQMISTRQAETFIADGLADTLVYRRQSDDILRDYLGLDADKDLRLVTPADYLTAKNIINDKGGSDHIAILYAVGDISDSGKEGIVGPDMVGNIVSLANDDHVKGMVFRVNSPGGSAFASEQIWEALEYFKSKGKPLYVSMGDYAASGGYYISCGADSIFADRTTITGSIGVFGMIPDLSGLVTDKLGVTFTTVETNPNAAGINGLEPMTPAQHAAMQQSVDNIYELFTSRVAQGRGLSQDYVKSIAEGRVWVGTSALRLGLVDAIGSLETAVYAMAYDLDLNETDVVRYPKTENNIWEQVIRQAGGIDQLKAAGYDAETMRYINTVRRITTANPIQARIEPVIFK